MSETCSVVTVPHPLAGTIHLMGTHYVCAGTCRVLPRARHGWVGQACPLEGSMLEGRLDRCGAVSRTLRSGLQRALPLHRKNSAWFPVLLLNVGKSRFLY